MKRLTLALILFCQAASVYAAPRTKLQWEAVPQNKGYIVQVKNATEVKEFKVSENKLELDLAPGEYQIRLAALNKFGKPSEFTDWVKITRKEDSKETVNLAQEMTKPEQKPDRTDEKKTESTPGARTGFPWSAFIPGYRQIKAGNTIRGIGYISALAASGGFFYRDKVAGDRIANDPLNNPAYLLLFLYPVPDVGGYVLTERRLQQKAHYKKFQHRQGKIAAGAVAIYGLSVVDGIFWSRPGAAASFQINRHDNDVQSAVALTLDF